MDAVIANAENGAGGFGLTEKVVRELRDAGVHVLTTGNHIWDKREGIPLLESENAVLRPHNYPSGNPGRGTHRLKISDDQILWVLNLQGRIFMPPLECPFRCADAFLERKPDVERCVLVDFHAEATSEKRALGFYLDGRVSAVIGTHTHVQTADEEILPKGTGYLSDAGMTGPYRSVIGTRYEDSLHRMMMGTPKALNVAKENAAVAGVFLELDDVSGRCLSIERLFLRENET
jgi:metallophosphoesterase (TIGR00282 family)